MEIIVLGQTAAVIWGFGLIVLALIMAVIYNFFCGKSRKRAEQLRRAATMIYTQSPLAIGLFIFFVLFVLGLSFFLARRTSSAEGYYAAGGQFTG